MNQNNKRVLFVVSMLISLVAVGARSAEVTCGAGEPRLVLNTAWAYNFDGATRAPLAGRLSDGCKRSCLNIPSSGDEAYSFFAEFENKNVERISPKFDPFIDSVVSKGEPYAFGGLIFAGKGIYFLIKERQLFVFEREVGSANLVQVSESEKNIFFKHEGNAVFFAYKNALNLSK